MVYNGDKKVTIGAHRASWQIHYGDIPHGLFVCHHCDNPSCVRPDHLFLGTQQQNIDDMMKKGRCGTVGENNRGNKITKEMAIEIIRLRKSGVRLREIAKRFDLHYNHIGRIARGERWKSIRVDV